MLVCENFRDPRNTGAAFRLADALGAASLYLTGKTTAPPNRKLARAARATEKTVPFTYYAEPAEALRRLKAEGYILIALEITNASEDIRTVDFRVFSKIALVAGAESEGVSQASLALVDRIIKIPMFGKKSSINVSTALAIALYEIIRQWDEG